MKNDKQKECVICGEDFDPQTTIHGELCNECEDPFN